MKTLSIIIVNYNAERFLKQCLASIYSSKRNMTFETILVDNNSIDGSVSMVRKEFPQVCLVENAENTGFAKASNRGIKICFGIQWEITSTIQSFKSLSFNEHR